MSPDLDIEARVRRPFVIHGLARARLVLALVTFSLMGASASEALPPNIVLIVADDHGTGDLAAYGNQAIPTPHLDRLADASVRFTRAYTTAASCTPSRSTIQSGLHNHANGLYGLSHHTHHFRAFESVFSLSRLLAEVGGYRTARVGKFHVAPDSIFPYQTLIASDVLNPVEMAEKTRPFLETRRAEAQPFFLYFATIAPHRSGTYREDLPHRPNDFHNRREGYPGVETMEVDPDSVVVPPYLPDTPACRQELAQYYQAVSRLDQGVGRLLALLRETGHWENTLVLYLSDNGIAFPGAKTNLYEPGVRLPLLVKLPAGAQGGATCDALVSWTDLTPTLLDFAGILPAAERLLAAGYEANKGAWDSTFVPGFQGRSLRPLLEAPERIEGWDEVYASHTFHEVTMYYPMRAVITRDFKLIWNIASDLPYPNSLDLWHSATWQYAMQRDGNMGPRSIEAYTHRPRFELYDLRSDPWESRNLAQDPAYAAELLRLQGRLRAFQERTGDPWVLKWERE